MEDTTKTNIRPSDYKPVSCGFYDHFEAAAIQRKKVVLEIMTDEGSLKNISAVIIDFFHRDQAEFMKLIDGKEIRLDKIFSINGITSNSC